MTKKYFPLLIIVLNLIVINGFLYYYINLDYPMVGHDYSLAIPSMLDTLIHFRNNGISIQWFTPSFGGGIPAYPNPNNGQFSILEVLPIWMNPWLASYVSSTIYICLGFLGVFRFINKILNYSTQSSILGAVFFSASGFILQRMAVGHLGYQPFPILAIILLLFFEPSLPFYISSLLLGLIGSLLLNQAGYFIVVISALTASMIFPLVFLLNPKIFSWKRMISVLIGGLVIGTLLSASKLSAVYSFMRYFPRLSNDIYITSVFSGFWGIILQLLGTMNLVPLFFLAGLDPIRLPDFLIFASGAQYGYWEFDMSLTPMVFMLWLVGATKFFHFPKKYLREINTRSKQIALAATFFFTWISVEFTLASGLLFPILKRLPILGSMHVNPRYAAAFIFPSVLLAVFVYNQVTKNLENTKTERIFLVVNILALLPLISYLYLDTDVQMRIYDLTSSNKLYQSVKNGEKFTITQIGTNLTNTEALQQGASNLNLYEPIFGYKLENFHPEVTLGSVWNEKDGYLNMTNPVGYVFPNENNTRPFQRFSVIQRADMTDFVSYHQPDWLLPGYQVLMNYLSITTLVIAIITLLTYLTAKSLGIFINK